MKKMVYFCPVDWRWIKQRPQFLAEELGAYYRVHVAYPFSKNRKGLQKKSATSVTLTPYVTLPAFGGRFPLLNRLNGWLARAQVAFLIQRVRPDVVWVTLPAQLDMIPKRWRERIVYDCMDDYVAMNSDEAARARILREEGDLVRAAKLVFATSETLRGKLCARYGAEKMRIQLLRNGYNAKWKAPGKAGASREGWFKIGYFGTISHWFDFDLIEKSLIERGQIEYHLFGPVAGGVQIPQHDRVIWHGVVEHDEIERCAAQMDALIMPFALNDIVLSVDPVKLYEYICLGKNILCIRYPEVERFAPFVHFYGTQEEYIARIDALLADPSVTYDKMQADAFLAENSWGRRAQSAYRSMQALEEGK